MLTRILNHSKFGTSMKNVKVKQKFGLLITFSTQFYKILVNKTNSFFEYVITLAFLLKFITIIYF